MVNKFYPRTPIKNGIALISFVPRRFHIFTHIGLNINQIKKYMPSCIIRSENRDIKKIY